MWMSPLSWAFAKRGSMSTVLAKTLDPSAPNCNILPIAELPSTLALLRLTSESSEASAIAMVL